MLPVLVSSKNKQSIEQLLPCRKNTSTCASSMSCQSCQLMWRSCINPVHMDHQYQRADMQVSCSNHLERTILSTVSMFPNSSKPQINEECLLRTCWKPRKLDPSWYLRPCVGCVGKSLSCWCHSCRLGRVAEADLYQWPGTWPSNKKLRESTRVGKQSRIMLPVPDQLRARMSRALNKFCHAGRIGIRTCASSMSCQSRQLLWSWCSNPVHIDHQHRTESTHAGVASDHCERTIPFLVSILDKRVSPSHCWKPRKLEFGRHLKPCVGKTFGRWRCCVTTHLGWGSGLRQEWAQHAALPGFHNRSMTLSRVSDLR